MNKRNWLIILPLFLAILFVVSACNSSSNANNPEEVEAMLIEKEQEKWEKFFAGQSPELAPLYADDFINISPSPTGTVRQNKEEADEGLSQLPPFEGEFDLSDFRFVHMGKESVVVSYKVTTTFGNEYATSVWALRDGKWVTVLYQATTI